MPAIQDGSNSHGTQNPLFNIPFSADFNLNYGAELSQNIVQDDTARHPLPNVQNPTGIITATSIFPPHDPQAIPTSPISHTPRSPTSSSSRIRKRELNTLAARRYRKKRESQLSTLEAELLAVKSERDELRVRVARLEGETEILRAMVQGSHSGKI